VVNRCRISTENHSTAGTATSPDRRWLELSLSDLVHPQNRDTVNMYVHCAHS
jgi:hypothetical protein